MKVEKQVSIIINDQREIQYLSNIAELARRRMAESDSHIKDADIPAMNALDNFLTNILEATN